VFRRPGALEDRQAAAEAAALALLGGVPATPATATRWSGIARERKGTSTLRAMAEAAAIAAAPAATPPAAELSTLLLPSVGSRTEPLCQMEPA